MKHSLCIVLCTALCSLAGCGFHLRGVGAAADDVQPVRVEYERSDLPLSHRIGEVLRDAEVPIVQTAGNAVVTSPLVRLAAMSETRKGRSFTQGIQVAEYELTVQVTLSIVDAQAQSVMAPTVISASRSYVRDTANLLTNETQESVLWEELRNDVAQQVIRVLAARLKKAS